MASDPDPSAALPSLAMGFFDSHCHLDPSVYGDDAGVDQVVARAHEAGVRRMVNIGCGTDAEAFERALAVAERHPSVWATAGTHPHDASRWTAQTADAIRRVAPHPRLVAIGELGLDFHYDSSPRDQQREVLRVQVRLALELALPIIVHDRESQSETFQILREEQAFSGAGLLYHCFTGTPGEMAAIVEAGGYVSIPGIVTFKNAGVMREVAREVPADRYMVETDSPYLTPIPFRGQKNEPGRVPLVGAAVAAARGTHVDEIARQSWQNASRFFRIDDPA